MPTTADVKSLISGFVEGNWYRVKEVSDRIANRLNKQGHKEDAEWIKDRVSRRDIPSYLENSESNHYYQVTHPTTSLDELIVPYTVKSQIQQVIKEYSKRQVLKEHGLNNANKILLVGSPGVGKTMTAEILAHELDLSLKTLRQEHLITSLMGKTAKNLSDLMPSYQEASSFPAVYFFDEFDTLASKRITAARSTDREYNEITNVLLKTMDHINPDCFFVAASNLSDGFDPAVFRRFDMIITFPGNNSEIVEKLLIKELADVTPNYQPTNDVCSKLTNFPPSVVKSIALSAKKAALLDNVEINDNLLLKIANTKKV